MPPMAASMTTKKPIVPRTAAPAAATNPVSKPAAKSTAPKPTAARAAASTATKSATKSATTSKSTKEEVMKKKPEDAEKKKRDEERAAEEAEDAKEKKRDEERAARALALKQKMEAEELDKKQLKELEIKFWEDQMQRPYWELPLGKCPERFLEGMGAQLAIQRATKVLEPPKTPLLLDNNDNNPVDTFYSYQNAQVLEAKKMFMDENQKRATREEILEGARKQLVSALKYGSTLYVRMANSAADLVGKYSGPTTFPLAVFDRKVVQDIEEIYTQKNLYESDSPLAACLRESDLDHGVFVARPGFEVIVCSHFQPEDFHDFLKDSLPMDLLQPIRLVVQ